MCGLGGAFLSLVFVPRWQNNITAGAGWIAVAFVIFCTWDPIKAIFAAWAFGALRGVGFKFQGFMNAQLLDMLPYVATILILIFISLQKKKEYQPPEALGNPYFREER